MDIQLTPIKGLLLINTRVIDDSRGYFFEAFRQDILQDQGFTDVFVQDNESKSQKGVLRGLHFQNPPHAQAKLVRVVKGAILDVVVDIRKNSETYGHHFSVELSEKNKSQLLVPTGFAHGFVTLSDNTILNYKCSNYYNKDAEQTLLWNDDDLAINWEIDNPILSAKDMIGEPFKTFNSSF